MPKYLVAPGLTNAQAAELAAQHDCGGYYLSVPPVWRDVSVEQGWTYPCVVTMGEDGLVADWEAV